MLIHHALRNAMLPTLTNPRFSSHYLITARSSPRPSSSWPGIGSMLLRPARLDNPAIVCVTINRWRGVPHHQLPDGHRLMRWSIRAVKLSRQEGS